jgi:hypothetical protein
VTIANIVHSEGLPFSIVDKLTFYAMLHEAHFAPAKYNVPTGTSSLRTIVIARLPETERSWPTAQVATQTSVNSCGARLLVRGAKRADCLYQVTVR